MLQIAQGSSTSLSLLSHRHTNTHIYIPHYTGRQQITAPTASTLNSPKASFTSKQGLSDPTLEGRQQPTLFFHLARRQEHRWINNTTQPRGVARTSTTSLLLISPQIFQYLVKTVGQKNKIKSDLIHCGPPMIKC